ncbi:MAG: CatB-related O-acetyltransferase [Oscillospiraceae bacterium]|nr:CatB-related O-acetyltransferase [Oscillospiraceae bacterium]
MNISYILKRSFHRMGRILRGKNGIWCTYGKKNVFSRGALLHEYCTVGSYNHFGARVMLMNARVGNYCSIAPEVKIGQMDHDLHCVSTSTWIFGSAHGITDGNGFDRPAVIDHDVWLGANVVVKQGVHIATGAVVGAGSVVTKDIPPYAIAVGSPAKVIRYRFEESVIEKLLESKWWELEPDEAVKRCRELQKLVDGET